jgi:hypothetical protein
MFEIALLLLVALPLGSCADHESDAVPDLLDPLVGKWRGTDSNGSSLLLSAFGGFELSRKRGAVGSWKRRNSAQIDISYSIPVGARYLRREAVLRQPPYAFSGESQLVFWWPQVVTPSLRCCADPSV